jgi:hypothetical protein
LCLPKKVLDTSTGLWLDTYMTNTTNALAEAIAAMTTEKILDCITLMDTNTTPSADDRAVKAHLCDEVEARYPAVTAVMEAWLDDIDGRIASDTTYAATLVAAVRAAV